MYTYYKEIIDKEHYLLQKEVTAVSGFVSEKGNPHTQLIGAALKDYIKRNNLEQMYWFSSFHAAMLSVYQKSIYLPMLEELYNKIGNVNRGSIEIGEKKYVFCLTHKAFGGVA